MKLASLIFLILFSLLLIIANGDNCYEMKKKFKCPLEHDAICQDNEGFCI